MRFKRSTEYLAEAQRLLEQLEQLPDHRERDHIAQLAQVNATMAIAARGFSPRRIRSDKAGNITGYE